MHLFYNLSGQTASATKYTIERHGTDSVGSGGFYCLTAAAAEKATTFSLFSRRRDTETRRAADGSRADEISLATDDDDALVIKGIHFGGGEGEKEKKVEN